MSSHVSATSSSKHQPAAAPVEAVGAMELDKKVTKTRVKHELIEAYSNVPSRSENPTKEFFLDKTKGVGLGLGAINSAARLAAMASPESSGPFAHVANLTGEAGKVLAIPNAVNGAFRTFNAFQKHQYVNATQYSFDAASSVAKAASGLVVDRASSVALGSISGIFKSASNTVDLGSSVKKFLDLREARAAIAADKKEDKPFDANVEKGLDSAFTATTLKVGRLVCALFAGALTLLAFVFKVTLSKELLIAGAVASLASIVLGIFSELTKENAEFNVVLHPTITKTKEQEVALTMPDVPKAAPVPALVLGASA